MIGNVKLMSFHSITDCPLCNPLTKCVDIKNEYGNNLNYKCDKCGSRFNLKELEGKHILFTLTHRKVGNTNGR